MCTLRDTHSLKNMFMEVRVLVFMKVYGYLQLNDEELQNYKLKDSLEDWFIENKLVCTRIFEEHVSGAVNAKNRTNLQELIKRLKRGDRLVIPNIDRLGGSRKDALNVLKQLLEMEVYVGILDVPGLNRYYTLLHVEEYKKIMELFLYEEEQIVELQYRIKSGSTLIGMKRAMAQGKKVGRKPVIDPPEKFCRDYEQYKHGYLKTMMRREFCKYEGISKSTYHNYERKLLERKKREKEEWRKKRMEELCGKHS